MVTRNAGDSKEHRADVGRSGGTAAGNVSAANVWAEWQECRSTIARIDQLLADLRKFGFSLVTGLLTASSLAGGISKSGRALSFASVAIMVLVLALFGVDRYYQIILLGAIGRGRSLEGHIGVAITTTIERYRVKTGAILWTLFLYLALALASLLIGLVGGESGVQALVIAFGFITIIPMLAYEGFATWQMRLLDPPRSG